MTSLAQAPLVQTSLFDLGSDPDAGVGLGTLDGLVRRQPLGRGAWVDLLPGWLSGSSDLLDTLLTEVPWQAERRQMYDRVVEVPRLLSFYGEGDQLPHPDLVAARDALNAHYGPELGEPLVTAGLCLYRDGRDSVAWHGDTIGRGRVEDTMVAIISLGSARSFLLRPRAGAPGAYRSERASLAPGALRAGSGGGAVRHRLGHGDLIVMGGSCQRTWEHAVPKTAQAVGPRISIQFRPRGVR